MPLGNLLKCEPTGHAARRGTDRGRGGLGAGGDEGRPPGTPGGRPGHRRDRATGQRRARRSRHEPRPAARPPAADGAGGDRGRAHGRDPEAIATAVAGRSRRPPSPAPASSISGSRTQAIEEFLDAVRAPPGRLGPSGGGGQRPEGQRRVRLGQPDRPADRGQRARGVRRRSPLSCPRGRRPARHPRVLLQRLGGAGPEARRVGARDPRRPRGARGRLPRRLRRRPRARRADGARGAVAAPRRTRTQLGGRPLGVASGSGRASRHPSNALGVALRRLDDRGQPPRRAAGSTGPSPGSARAVISTSRTARRGSARPPSATTRTASSSARTAA